VRLDQRDQRRPENDALHLVEERALGRQVQAKVCLIHGRDRRRMRRLRQFGSALGYADLT